MDLTKITEDTASGGCAAFTRARVGGGDDKVIRKPTEKKKGTGLKPDALVAYAKGWKRR